MLATSGAESSAGIFTRAEERKRVLQGIRAGGGAGLMPSPSPRTSLWTSFYLCSRACFLHTAEAENATRRGIAEANSAAARSQQPANRRYAASDGYRCECGMLWVLSLLRSARLGTIESVRMCCRVAVALCFRFSSLASCSSCLPFFVSFLLCHTSEWNLFPHADRR